MMEFTLKVSNVGVQRTVRYELVCCAIYNTFFIVHTISRGTGAISGLVGRFREKKKMT